MLRHIPESDLPTEKKGQTKEAIHHYHEALKINPDDPKAHYRLGYEFINTGELKKRGPTSRALPTLILISH